MNQSNQPSQSSLELERLMSSLGGEDFMKEKYDSDDNSLMEQFQSSQLPVNYFQRHRTHIRLAYLFLKKYNGYEGAFKQMSADLKKYFEHHVINSKTTGYHETLTVAWLRVVNHIISNFGDAFNSNVFCDTHPFLLHNSLMRMYYKADTIYSEKAKAEFVAPDLNPLPK